MPSNASLRAKAARSEAANLLETIKQRIAENEFITIRGLSLTGRTEIDGLAIEIQEQRVALHAMRCQLLPSKQQLAEDIRTNSTAYKKKFTSLNLRITQSRRRLCRDAAAIFGLHIVDGKSYIRNLLLPDFDTNSKGNNR